MKIIVVGAGAIGAFYGGKLAQAGAEVSVLCRSNYEAVCKNGFKIESIYGNFTFRPANVLRYVSEYLDTADYIFVTTKVLPEENIAKMIMPLVKPETSIALLQNGMFIEKPFVEAFPNNELFSGIAFACINQIAPGVISHLDYGKVEFGCYPTGISTKLKKFGALFTKAGLEFTYSSDTTRTRWQKLILNAPLNPLSVLCGKVRTDDIIEHAPTFELCRNIMEEVRMLAQADGHALADDVIEVNIGHVLKMAPYKTSMLMDFEAGRNLEIEAILGNAIRFAETKKINVPYLKTVYAILSLEIKQARS